jgi:hypothetical protein
MRDRKAINDFNLSLIACDLFQYIIFVVRKIHSGNSSSSLSYLFLTGLTFFVEVHGVSVAEEKEESDQNEYSRQIQSGTQEYSGLAA